MISGGIVTCLDCQSLNFEIRAKAKVTLSKKLHGNFLDCMYSAAPHSKLERLAVIELAVIELAEWIAGTQAGVGNLACRLNRLIRLIRIVRGRSFPKVADLCRIFQIKERTLFNDLKELREDLGVEIQFDRTKNGYYLASDFAEISIITLKEEAAFLLLGAFAMFSWSGGESFATPLRDVFGDEINLCLDNYRNGDYQSLAIHDSVQNVVDGDIFAGLCRACLLSRAVRVLVKREALSSLGIEQLLEASGTSFEEAESIEPAGKILESDAACVSFPGWVRLTLQPNCMVFSGEGWKVKLTDGIQIPLSCIEQLESSWR